MYFQLTEMETVVLGDKIVMVGEGSANRLLLLVLIEVLITLVLNSQSCLRFLYSGLEACESLCPMGYCFPVFPLMLIFNCVFKDKIERLYSGRCLEWSRSTVMRSWMENAVMCLDIFSCSDAGIE